MRLLLDTQSAYWWLTDNRKLSRKARRAIADSSNVVRASVISIYEIGLKVSRGRLTDDKAIYFTRLLVEAGFDPIPLSAAHMESGGLLGWRHSDPWDRLYAAQAMAEGFTLVSVDEAFDELPLKRLW